MKGNSYLGKNIPGRKRVSEANAESSGGDTMCTRGDEKITKRFGGRRKGLRLSTIRVIEQRSNMIWFQFYFLFLFFAVPWFIFYFLCFSCFIHFSCFFLFFIVFFSITIQSPYIPFPTPQSPPYCPHPWVLFPFCSTPHALLSPRNSCHLLSIYDSVSIVLVHSVCSLDSIEEWNYMVFVFLWLAYFI